VVHAGDASDALYLIKQGVVSLTSAKKRTSAVDGVDAQGTESTQLQVLSHFGAFALTEIDPATGWRVKSGHPQWDRSAVADSAHGPAVLLKLTKEKMLERVGPLEEVVKLNRMISILHNVPLFRELDFHELRQLAISACDVQAEICKGSGEHIIKQGDVGDCMWILRSGTVTVTREVGGQVVVIKDELGEGAYFGESAILNDDVRSASIIATSDCRLTLILRTAVQGLLGSLEGVAAREHRRREREARKALAAQFTLDSLRQLAPLGSGTFGRIYLVEHESQRTFALKQITKHLLISTKQVDHIIYEKEVLLDIDHPFCNQIIAVLRDEAHVYLVLEVALGGELFSRMRQVGALDVNAVRFYSTCVAAALAHLHGRKVVYRDLKPENILLDSDGYPKLIDFGFAKQLKTSPRTWTLCGTPHYLAPEIITSQGHGIPVDWWSFGVLVYEMMTGAPPFNGESELEIYKQITKNRVAYGGKLNAKAKDLISSLLVSDPLQRLGSGKLGDEGVLSHGFLKGAMLSQYLLRTVEAPWLPKIKGETDTSQFEFDTEEFEELAVIDVDDSFRKTAAYQREEARLNSAFEKM